MKRLRLLKNTIYPIYRPITSGSRFDPVPDDAGLSLNIMSFNIRRGTAKDGRNHWIFRQNLVHEMLKRYHPDILGLQEAMDFQITALHSMLPGYEMVGIGSLGGNKGMHTAIFFNAARFSLSDEGTFWLSDTPDIPGSKGWGNILPRTCTWARLVDRDSGQAFYFYNTHLDHLSQRSRKKSVVLLAQYIHTRSFSDPFILMGDFNARERSVPIQFLKGKVHMNMKAKGMVLNPTPLLDTFRLQYPNHRHTVTFHGFRRFFFRFRLDYIFVPSSIRVQDTIIIQLRWKKRYPSDHFPLLARIDIPAPLVDSNYDHYPKEMMSIPKAR
ncbi:MAG: endonuclease/exonuclease/phosphatase family protein [Proteobacteria bacterium]|nr:endonuclease/exonuclease/phosphatase family protein [Pseudomonadota bacterium]